MSHEKTLFSNDKSVRISDALARPIFKDALLLAGSKGTSRAIRWVHVLDIADAQDAIRGGELILSTGIGFRARIGQEQIAFRRFVEQLIEGGAAGLCFELGTSFSEIPEDIVTLCEDLDFPLIVFPFHVRFVDITLDIHGLLLSKHHRLLDDLESISKKFQSLATRTGTVQETLALVHELVRAPVLYKQVGIPPTFYPTAPANWEIQTDGNWRAAWLSALPATLEGSTCVFLQFNSETAIADSGTCLAAQPVVVLGQTHGILSVLCRANPHTEYLTLLLDRAATPLAQEAFRQISLRERRRAHEQDYVVQLIRGEWSIAEQPNKGLYYYRIAIIQFEHHPTPSEAFSSVLDDIVALVRLALTQHRLRTSLAVRQDSILVLLYLPQTDVDWESRFQDAIRQTARAHTWQGAPSLMRVGVGVIARKQTEVKNSYETALEVMNILAQQRKFTVQFYEHSGIYRWISLLEDAPRARRLAEYHLEKIRDYDRLHQAHLLETLRMYLDCNTSKQQTAERLYIHRQTLYHRLQKITELIDVDINQPESRLSLHFALYYNMSRQRRETD